MNVIFGIYNKISKKEYMKNVDYFQHGNLTIYTNRIEGLFHAEKIYSIYKNEIFCSLIGYISNFSILCHKYNTYFASDVDLVAFLFSKNGEKSFKELEGIFAGVIWIRKSNILILFQDEFGSHLPLYYTIQSKSIIFSTTLKEILKHIENRELDKNAVKTLLSPFSDRFGNIKPNCVIPDSRTLVKGIYKLLPRQLIIIDCTSLQVKEFFVNYNNNNPFTYNYAKDNLILSIQKQTNLLASLLADKSIVTSTLSSGYDSNLVVNTLSQNTNLKSITAITIGGKVRNEIPTAKLCANSYKNVNHISRIVSENQLNKLPEIIWRNEGYISERGVFLSFEVAHTVCELKGKNVFLSDCADQILNKYITSNISNETIKALALECDFAKKRYFEYFYDNNINITFDVDTDYILKKSGILLNSYSIQPLYPFLNRRTKLYSELITLINHKKEFYKLEVEKLIPFNSKYFNKMGGTTDIEYLFQQHPNLIDLLLNQDIIKELLTELQTQYIRQYSYKYVKILLNLLVIHLFNELFITKNYDDNFDRMNLNNSIVNFFK